MMTIRPCFPPARLTKVEWIDSLAARLSSLTQMAMTHPFPINSSLVTFPRGFRSGREHCK
jgi:hypothetical protein